MTADHLLRFRQPVAVDTSKGFALFNPSHLRSSIKRTKVSSDQQQLPPDASLPVHPAVAPTTAAAAAAEPNSLDDKAAAAPGAATRFGTTLLRRALSTSGGSAGARGRNNVGNRPREQQQQRRKHRSSMIVTGASPPPDVTLPYTPDGHERPQSALSFSRRSEKHTPLPEVSMAEDEVLRRTAAVAIDRHVGQYMRLDELVSLVNPKKGGSSLSSSLWDRVKLHFRSNSAVAFSNNNNNIAHPASCPPTHNNSSSNRVFGQALDDVGTWTAALHNINSDYGGNVAAETTARADAIGYMLTHHPIMAACFSEHALVPPIMQNCILALLKQDLTVEGVFRKNGNIRDLKDMCNTIDRGEPYLHRLFNPSTCSAIQLAALLKRFLRDLPEPLLTYKLHRLFLASLRMPTEKETKTVLHLACCMLPKPNRDLLQLLCLCLHHVASLHPKNKMTAHNLAVVLTPSLLVAPPPPPSSQSLPGSPIVPLANSHEIHIIRLLIQHQPEFTMIPTQLSPLLDAHLDVGRHHPMHNTHSYASILRNRTQSAISLGGDHPPVAR